MLQTYTEERVVTYEGRRTVCDLCSEPVLDDSVFLRVAVFQSRKNGDAYLTEGEPMPMIDICSSKCLVEKGHVAGLLLNTKIIPEAENQIARRRNEMKDMEAKKASIESIYDQMNTGATRTGRFKASSPNLSNIPKSSI